MYFLGGVLQLLLQVGSVNGPFSIATHSLPTPDQAAAQPKVKPVLSANKSSRSDCVTKPNCDEELLSKSELTPVASPATPRIPQIIQVVVLFMF